jgi:hypothetical protein
MDDPAIVCLPLDNKRRRYGGIPARARGQGDRLVRDYQQGKPHRGVIEARFFLIDYISGKYSIVFNKRATNGQ